MTKTRIYWLLLASCASLLAFWWWGPRGNPGQQGVASEPQGVSNPHRGADLALEGAGASQGRSKGISSALGAAADEGSLSVSGIVTGGTFGQALEGAVIECSYGADGSLEGNTGQPAASVRTDRSGRYKLPLPVESREDAGSVELVLTVTHDLALAERRVILHGPEGPGGASSDSLREDFVLERVFPIVGQLLDERSQDPLQGSVHITHTLDARESLKEVARVETGADGRFRLELSQWTPDALWAIGTVIDLLPTERELRLKPNGITDVGVIHVQVGASIRGQVRSTLPEWAKAASLDIQSAGEDSGVLFSTTSSGAYLWSEHAGPVLRVRRIPLQSDGLFHVGGLVPGTYVLMISQGCKLAVARQQSAYVDAPNDWVELKDASAVFSLQCIDATTGGKLPGGKMFWDHIQGFHCWVGGGRSQLVSVDPHRELHGVLVLEGYYRSRVYIPPALPGSAEDLVVRMQPLPPDDDRGTRQVYVVDEQGEPIPSLEILVREVPDSEEARTGRQALIQVSRFERSTTGRYSVPVVPPGEYSITLQPNSLLHLLRSPLVAEHLEHTVPFKGGAIDEPVVLRRGAALTVRIRDVARGRYLRSTVSVTRDGEPTVDAWIPAEEEAIQVYFGWVPGRGAMRLRDALPEGLYDVHVSAEGYEPASQPVELLWGGEATLEFALEPVPE
jgi:hypothetical protein